MANGDPPTFTRGQVLKADDLMALVQWCADKFKSLDTGGSTGGIQSDNSNEPATDLFFNVFPAKITGNGSNGTLYKWDEYTNVAGNITAYGTPGTDGRQCANTSLPSAAIELNGATFIPNGTIVSMIELRDGVDHRYQFQCTCACFTITGVSGSANATNFSPYSTSQGAPIWNVFEPLGGTPGSLGGNVTSNGTAGSGTCVVKGIGNITMPCTWDVVNKKWLFTAPNSAF